MAGRGGWRRKRRREHNENAHIVNESLTLKHGTEVAEERNVGLLFINNNVSNNNKKNSKNNKMIILNNLVNHLIIGKHN